MSAAPINLTEDRACGAIMDIDRVRRNFCLPRYTPARWWECDVFELTKTGYFREYEVKLTLADFKADAQKQMEQRPWHYGTPPVWENKHEFLSRGDPRGPTQFWFVTPVGLIPRELLPQWAGLIELRCADETFTPSRRWWPTTVVEAPKLHKEKASDKIREHALGVCYYRLHDMMRAARDRAAPAVAALAEEAITQ